MPMSAEYLSSPFESESLTFRYGTKFYSLNNDSNLRIVSGSSCYLPLRKAGLLGILAQYERDYLIIDVDCLMTGANPAGGLPDQTDTFIIMEFPGHKGIALPVTSFRKDDNADSTEEIIPLNSTNIFSQLGMRGL